MKRWCVVLDTGNQADAVIYARNKEEAEFVSGVLRRVFDRLVVRRTDERMTLSEQGLTAYAEEYDIEQQP